MCLTYPNKLPVSRRESIGFKSKELEEYHAKIHAKLAESLQKSFNKNKQKPVKEEKKEKNKLEELEEKFAEKNPKVYSVKERYEEYDYFKGQATSIMKYDGGALKS